MVFIKKIRIKPGKDKPGEFLTLIEYDIIKGPKVDTYSVQTWDPPLKEFHEALQRLKEDALEICEMEVDHDHMRIHGVSFSSQEMGDGVTITWMKSLLELDTELVINTPHLLWQGEKLMVSSRTSARLRDLCEHAKNFLNGSRAQLDLFAEGA